MVSYVPGALGGAITNCAHLRTTDGSIDVQACDTQTIAPAPACTPGTVGCGWKSGDVITYSQDPWGTLNTPVASLLADNFFAVFPAGGVEIGLSGAAGNSAFFSSTEAVLDYLSTTGSPDALDADLLDPMSTSAGVFAAATCWPYSWTCPFADAGPAMG